MTARQQQQLAPYLDDDIDSNSYTALRLQHASPEHIHLTTRRCFVGPIPEGWLKSHRKQWYRHYIARNYSSKAATFRAQTGTKKSRQVTGLDGPSASVSFAQAFPQPEDADDDEGDGDDSLDKDGGLEQVEDAGSRANIEDGDSTNDNEEDRDRLGSLQTTGNDKTKGEQNRASATKGHTHPSGKKKPSSFVTAFSRRKPRADNTGTSPPQPSFHTAYTSPEDIRRDETYTDECAHAGTSANDDPEQSPPSHSAFSNQNDQIDGETSTTALLDSDNAKQGQDHETDPTALEEPSNKRSQRLVKFNTDNINEQSDNKTLQRLNTNDRRRSWRRMRKGEHHPGEIVKAEKMLLRVEQTMDEIPAGYNENESIKIETRVIEKWREFVVVCRESTSEDEDFSLQMYKTRVIPVKAQTHVQGHSTHEIPLSHRKTKINLYSSLDKTLVIWVPWKKGSLIYILRARSAASAVEWYTFLRQSLGWKRSTKLQINVPDLSVALQLENPFGDLEASMLEAKRAKSDTAVMKTMEAEKAVASHITSQVIEALKDNPEWSSVLDVWLSKEKIGLAWKRYDRLEWVHGANEQRMYGTLAMQRTHDLELRPKDHYPTGVRAEEESLTEPAPVEGFLVRLTSQKGSVRRLGRMYYKRLYFTTHNQYLCYCRPARALPPPPPRLPEREDSKVPSANEIVDNSPLIYSVNPFPVRDGQIEWLKHSAAIKAQHDEEAYKESERKIMSMLHTEGYINLLHVRRVQNATRGNSVADQRLDSGSEVDFHEDVSDTPRDDGKVEAFDDNRTFELVMTNNLVIRLQAYDEQTKKEWIHRLRALSRYWKLRLRDDMHLLQSVRDENLERLGIDEEMEASIGQFASKWEVTRSVASSKLFHMCGISCCRAVTLAGTLYHKPKRRSTFLRSGVILCHGKLLVFHGTLRKRTGEEVPHIQHNRHSVLDLQNCYIYSGLLTEGDLLYQNKTFDANHPGHHALPRVYLNDGWTSVDEDTMTCFVIWQPRNKSWFKATEDIQGTRDKTRQRLRHVSRLGVPGRSIVFKARSRAERDHWVTSISMEVERMQSDRDDIRVVDKA